MSTFYWILVSRSSTSLVTKLCLSDVDTMMIRPPCLAFVNLSLAAIPFIHTTHVPSALSFHNVYHNNETFPKTLLPARQM